MYEINLLIVGDDLGIIHIYRLNKNFHI